MKFSNCQQVAFLLTFPQFPLQLNIRNLIMLLMKAESYSCTMLRGGWRAQYKQHRCSLKQLHVPVNAKVYFCNPSQSSTFEPYDPHQNQLPGKSNKTLQVAYTLASLLAHFWFYGRSPIGNGRRPWELISDQKHSTTIVITSRKLKSLNWLCRTLLKMIQYALIWLKIGKKMLDKFLQ